MALLSGVRDILWRCRSCRFRLRSALLGRHDGQLLNHSIECISFGAKRCVAGFQFVALGRSGFEHVPLGDRFVEEWEVEPSASKNGRK